MKKTIVELFAGVGGFRLGFEKASKEWETVWANQWEPGKKSQHAFDCYKHHFQNSGGINAFSNTDINQVNSADIPTHNLLVGGFPCQDYSVAGTKTKGIVGKKGVLWWDINRILQDKRPSFVLLENVDRLLKSPANQRGRDFGIILHCLNSLGYAVEWRIINAADYGLQQRRRRIFIFAFKKNTKFYQNYIKNIDLLKCSFFSKIFPVTIYRNSATTNIVLPEDIVDLSNNFKFEFENSGYMDNGKIYTIRTEAINTTNKQITLRDIMEEEVSEKYCLSQEEFEKFTYMKGAKKESRTTKNGFLYNYSEGPVPFPDLLDRPARTMLTSESSNNRSTHIVEDKKTKKLRKLTPVECERINGFNDNWTNTGMPEKFRYFCMGNALVVDLITMMANELNEIFDNE